jgi:Ca2+-binding RTX toxin-like protein
LGKQTDSLQSQANTPQANDDTYGWGVDDLLHAGVLNGNIVTVDVMANDTAGKGKSLWSVDDGDGHPEATDHDLVGLDVSGVYEDTALNNLGVCDRIAIVDGKVRLDLSHSLAQLGVSDVSAMTMDTHIHDTFVYAIRMGNGTLSQGTVTVDIWGTGVPVDSDTSHDFDTLTAVATGRVGSHADDILVGTDGVDGSGGTINGGPGDDLVYASGGSDIILGGSEDDRLYGQAGDDTIWGKSGCDVLFGGSGNDVLEGDGNSDVLWGGSGNDVFRYMATSESVGPTGTDLIADFHHGCDRIDVSAIDANTADAGDTAFVWGGNVAVAHGVWFTQNGTDTVLHFDTDGNTASDEMTITLSGTGLLNAADFVL